MFYNGFTLLMQLLAGLVAYHIGRKHGYIRGGQDTYKRLIDAKRSKSELYAGISKKNWNSNSW